MTDLIQEISGSQLSIRPLETLQAKHFEETPLYFRNGAMDIDPKRGLSVHGPVDAQENVQTIRIGVISDSKGIQDITSCFEYLNNNPVKNTGEQPFTTLTFPGFVEAFHSRLILSKTFNEKLLSKEISDLVHIHNPNLRIKRVAKLYAKKASSICDRVVVPDVIICHKPAIIEKTCNERRSQGLTKEEREEAQEIRRKVETHRILAPLDQDTKNFIEMTIRADFRRILKSASIKIGVPLQILKQSTLEALNYAMRIHTIPSLKHGKQDSSTIAWNLAVALYYKANHFPWRVGNLSSGSCYIGISFYYDQTTHERNMFASLAQIFTETGEGMVVRGDSFHWDTRKKGQPHLTKNSAQSLLQSALNLYKKHHDDQYPNRVVIHKSSRYTRNEVQGFLSASEEVPRYDYVALSDGRGAFYYRNGEHPVLRGTFIQIPGRSCLIYTRGYVPYQKSYFGPRVPKPLEISEHHGDTPPEEIATEIIALTRLDWNTTHYSLYKPITLGFAEKVGSILGSIQQGEKIQHQYRFYM